MNNQLKNIYTYLIINNKHQYIGWYTHYESFASNIAKIRDKLINGQTLDDLETYENTIFASENSQIAYANFLTKLLYEKENGISSRGQSVLSKVNLDNFEQDNDLKDIISNLVVNHDLDSYTALQEFWRNQGIGFNPVLINRALAACTLDVSSTVDEGKFNQVFSWLQNERLIEPYHGEHNWYDKNIYAIEQIRENLRDVDEKNIDQYLINIFYWVMYENLAAPFNLKKQIVKHGAPGTGKTYKSKELANLQFSIWKDSHDHNNDFVFEEHIEMIQFHPSYSYEDFLEGLRPVLDENNQAQLKLVNGIFKNFCIKAGIWEIDFYHLNSSLKWKNVILSDLEEFREKLDGKHWNFIFQNEDKDRKVSDLVPPYFLIIDEINRAELSRVFGELMLCLEYRGVEGKVKTQYAQLNTKDTGMLEVSAKNFQFFIPHNVYILATMNTIDRSVESFDFALRRRFKWEEVKPDIELLKYHMTEFNNHWLELATNLDKLNQAISSEPLLGKDYCIGHAYLWELPYDKKTSLRDVRKAIWDDSISSLIQEYLRGTGRNDLYDTFAKSFGVK